jgi:hypothetical protein
MQAEASEPQVDTPIHVLEGPHSFGVGSEFHLSLLDELRVDQGIAVFPVFFVKPEVELLDPPSEDLAFGINTLSSLGRSLHDQIVPDDRWGLNHCPVCGSRSALILMFVQVGS